jgi:hypothetical protein
MADIRVVEVTCDFKLHYVAMQNALAATGRPIVFSICEWGLRG